MSIFDKQTTNGFDRGPSVQEIDADLRDVTEATLERYARDLDKTQIGNRSWEALPIEQRRAMRAGNELARRENEKKRTEARAAEDAKVEAYHAARIEAEIDAYRKQIRGAWKGDQASFDAAWPTLLQQWQIDQARAQMDAMQQRIRERVGGF